MFQKYIVVLLTTVLLVSGCQSNMTAKRIQAKNPLAKNSVKTPAKFVDVWNTYAQSVPEGGAMRGIAGRIHFYDDSKNKQSVKVDGDVTVFLFDGDEKDPAHAKPLRVYQFKAETLPKHYAFKKPLGHGYDFFLPFDEIGGPEKRLCVMTRFDDRLEGSFVLSKPVNTLLQGTKPEPSGPENTIQEFLASNTILGEANRKMAEQAIPPEMYPIRQVGYENAVSQDERKKDGDRNEENRNDPRPVTTVTLNDTLTRRLTQAPEQADFPRTAAPPMPLPHPPVKTELRNGEESTNKNVSESGASPHRFQKLEYPKVEFPEPPF